MLYGMTKHRAVTGARINRLAKRLGHALFIRVRGGSSKFKVTAGSFLLYLNNATASRGMRLNETQLSPK